MVNWTIGDLFLKDFGHHGSIKKLWHGKWAYPCCLGAHPFQDGKLQDFAPIFDHLIKENINDPYDDRWVTSFTPTAERLVKQADESAAAGDKDVAIELYKRGCAVYRISRFPYLNTSPLKIQAFEAQKKAYIRGCALWDVPIEDIEIPFKNKDLGDKDMVPLYVRTPNGASKAKPCKVILLITGLDDHRPDNTERTEEHLKRGWATIICDVPGVGDCPCNKRDPNASERYFDTILDWISDQPQFNSNAVIAWGLSAGGYYAIRLAHTHASRLIGSVGQGAGTHHYLGKEWLNEIDHHEYPFDIKIVYVGKYGYSSWEELIEKCQDEYSLVINNIVHRSNCRLFLVNGVLDSLMPIEDSMLLMEYGNPKEARFMPRRAHMGSPDANIFIFDWLEKVMSTAK